MNRVLVSVQDGLKEPCWLEKIEPFERLILERLGFDGEEISILFCTDDFIKELNKNFRKIDAATDVLSFENGGTYEDEEGTWVSAGDIIISLDTLPKNAAYFEVSENEELKRLLVHGTLHLNGMDHTSHISKDEELHDEMLVLQEKILSECGDYNIL